jgi:serine/threonine-protein kinase
VVPAQIGPYRIERLLGQGGMGSVYVAVDPTVGRRVALKTLQDHDPEALARFEREAKALAKVDHPGVIRIHSVARAGDGTTWSWTCSRARP